MFSISAFALSTIILLISLLIIQARAPLVKILLGGTLNEHEWKTLRFHRRSQECRTYDPYDHRRVNVLIFNYQACSHGSSPLRCCRGRLFLVGAGYVAVKTRNTIGIVAVVLFNTYLVIVGCESFYSSQRQKLRADISPSLFVRSRRSSAARRRFPFRDGQPRFDGIRSQQGTARQWI